MRKKIDEKMSLKRSMRLSCRGSVSLDREKLSNSNYDLRIHLLNCPEKARRRPAMDRFASCDWMHSARREGESRKGYILRSLLVGGDLLIIRVGNGRCVRNNSIVKKVAR